MFEQTFVTAQAKTRRPWTVATALSLQMTAIGFALIWPLLHPETLSLTAKPVTKLIATRLEIQPIPARHETTQAAPSRTPILVAPAPHETLILSAPSHSIPAIQAPSVEAGSGGWNDAGPALAGMPNGLGAPLPQLPAAREPAPNPVPAGPARVSAGVQAAKLIYGPSPVYSQIAKTARVQGTVRLEAIVGTDGTIRDLHAIAGPPLLIPIALEAVRTWRYQPTLLSGTAVEVATEIDVNFRLMQ